MTDLNTFAPWPDTEDKVTADAYARHLTVDLFKLVHVDTPRYLKEWEDAGLPRTGPLRDAYALACRASSATYGLIYLLRESAGPNTMPADKLALTVHAPYSGDFDEVVNDLDVWLEEYGISAEAILRAAEAQAEVA